MSDLYAPLWAFIKERQAIYNRRLAGMEPPWTSDPILRGFRFTNVRREDDRVTRWIADNWRTPNAENEDLWFAMSVARHVNLPETLEDIGYPVPWDPMHYLDVMGRRRAAGLPLYGNAYMIRPDRTGGKTTAEHQATRQFTPMWMRRKLLRPTHEMTLASYHALLMAEYGNGSFLAQQIIADLMYVEPLKSAPDWFTWCTLGPGSMRGLNLIFDRQPIDKPWKIVEFQEKVRDIQGYINGVWTKYFESEPLHAQNITNCLCEFSKYRLAQLGQSPKRRYYYHQEG